MDFREASLEKGSGVMEKLESFYEDYDRELRDYHDRPIRILEIGINWGGSLFTWRKFFPNAEKIVGVDIMSECKKFEEGNITVYIGDQTDAKFLRSVHEKEGPFDIIVDDGGHTMEQQQVSFRTLFPLLKDGGTYVIEDLHTSYWPGWGGKYGYTTIDMIKELIDGLHYWAKYDRRRSFFWKVYRHFYPGVKEPRNVFEEYVRSISISDSICFIRKGKTPNRSKKIKK